MVSNVPKKMMKEVEFLRCMECGGYLRFLDTQNFWMGRGGSKSVVHYDDQDNINCMLAGEKRFVFMHPSYKKDFEAHPNSAKNRFGWVDTDLDRPGRSFDRTAQRCTCLLIGPLSILDKSRERRMLQKKKRCARM
ncbi:unnamed protein product [Effrenium voratum]|nr:unnamed protein product [Effrenium voratum]